MEIIRDIADLHHTTRAWRKAGETIAFVPTMGNLHPGHYALVEQAHALGSKVVVSIFVNPAQFDRAADLEAYPRTLDADCAQLAQLKVDVVFVPTAADIYPTGFLRTRVEVPGISDVLEGEYRPGHFTGVATIVCKLFNMVEPDVAVFGEKDFQQLMVVRQMVQDLDIPVRIHGVQAVREADGLARSSRNGYLSADERAIAPKLHRILLDTATRLKAMQPEAGAGYTDDRLNRLQQAMMQQLAEAGFRPEYLEIRRAQDLQLPTAGDQELVILVSAWLGKARLIDNVQVFLATGEVI
ncbi:MAG: pantoate--beta-alanine ligase [Thiothrix sp.]|nr:pantoate--beta-alanine ligase [Thiothrix sp.]HPQ95898.1 pantoate--beta-alanine ligase [Thiolinea sp.]